MSIKAAAVVNGTYLNNTVDESAITFIPSMQPEF
jgi:hypothetical protein